MKRVIFIFIIARLFIFVLTQSVIAQGATPLTFYVQSAEKGVVRWGYSLTAGDIDAVKVDGKCLAFNAGRIVENSFGEVEYISGRFDKTLDGITVFTDYRRNDPKLLGVFFDFEFGWPDNLSYSVQDAWVKHPDGEWTTVKIPQCDPSPQIIWRQNLPLVTSGISAKTGGIVVMVILLLVLWALYDNRKSRPPHREK